MFRENDHAYIHIPTGKTLTPVTEVIKRVYATKSWDIKPEMSVDDIIRVMDNVKRAGERGSAVDKHMSTFISQNELRFHPQTESREVVDRVKFACAIWEQEFAGRHAETQKIVYSLEDGIAGTMDFWVSGGIVVDLKVTAQIEKSWILQLGAYIHMAPNMVTRAGIIHAPKGGGVWMEYDAPACERYWKAAVEWWLTSNDMAKTKISRKKNGG